ncbi:MAG: xylulokinase [Thermoprotei archaeon]|nr:MAG: xylulokinase [Thermoprotei archaeon]
MYSLGVDLGTTKLKVLLLDIESFKILRVIEGYYRTYRPKPQWAEQDPNDWWRVLTECLKKIPREDLEKVVSVGVVSQREGIVFIDKSGRLLGRCVIWMDRRCTKEALEIEEEYGLKEIYYRTRLRPDATFSFPKLLWFRKYSPEVLDKAEVYLQPKDYLVYRLTGEYTTDYTLASRTMMLDIGKLKWIDDFFSKYDIPNKFPRLYWSNEPIGEVTENTAHELGLPKGIPVAAGAGDRPAENFGAGAVKEGIVVESTGTTTSINSVLSKPLLDPECRIIVSVHMTPGRWLLDTGLSSTGSLLEWIIDNMFRDFSRDKFFERIDLEASKIPPGSEGVKVLPFFMGARAPWWKPVARGGLMGLLLGHSRWHIVRALMEAIAYEVKLVLDIVESLRVKVNEVRCIGGGARSKEWLKIKSAVYGKKVCVPEAEHAAALTAAVLGAMAAGLVSSLEEYLSRVQLKSLISPSADLAEEYRRFYLEYRETAKRFLEFF